MSYFMYCHTAHFKRSKPQKFLGRNKAEILWKAKVGLQPHIFEIAVFTL